MHIARISSAITAGFRWLRFNLAVESLMLHNLRNAIASSDDRYRMRQFIMHPQTNENSNRHSLGKTKDVDEGSNALSRRRFLQPILNTLLSIAY